MKTVSTLIAIVLGSAATLVIAAPEGGHHRGAMLERLQAADTNGDGLISRAEAAALPRVAGRFDQIDANRDQQLSQDEMRAFHQARRGKSRADADGDGRVIRAEFMAKAAERFARLDANNDGAITKDEMRLHGHGHGHGAK